MFNLNPFRKQLTEESINKPLTPLYLNEPIKKYSDFGFTNTLSYFSNIDREIFELLATPTSSVTKSTTFDNFIQVHTPVYDFKVLMPDKLGYSYRGGTKFKVKVDKSIVSGFDVGHQFIYSNGRYYRDLTSTIDDLRYSGTLGLLYQEFEYIQTPTIESNFINKMINDYFVTFDLLNPYIKSNKSNGFSVHTLIESVFLASITKISRGESSLPKETISFDKGEDTIPELTKIYKYSLTKLRDISRIESDLNLECNQYNSLLTSLGYSIASRLVDYLNDYDISQEFNQYYGLVKETNLQLDEITDKLYQDILDNKPINKELKTNIITVLEHQTEKVLEVMTNLDTKLPTTVTTYEDTNKEWKSFLQFLND